jgi:Fe-S-cluster containining protein
MTQRRNGHDGHDTLVEDLLAPPVGVPVSEVKSAEAPKAAPRGNGPDGFLPTKPPRAPIPLAIRPDGYAVLPEGNPCVGCDHCCRYIALEIDRPTTKKDFEHIRWYLLHRSVSIVIDWDGAWLLQFDTPCEWLVDGQCSHYELRPEICREYDPKECERYLPTESHKFLLKTEADLQKYLADREVRLAKRREARAEREKEAARKKRAVARSSRGSRTNGAGRVRAASRTRGRAPSGRRSGGG